MSLLGSLLTSAASRRRNEPAIVTPEGTWSYEIVDRASSGVAAGLLEHGIKPHDRIAVHLRNGIDLIVVYFACFKAGIVVVPINSRFKSPEIAYVLEHSAACAYIGEPALFTEVRERPAPVRSWWITGSSDSPDTRRFEDLQSVCAPADGRWEEVAVGNAAAILYTSGTTARPKGVTHSQASLASVAALATGTLFGPDDVVVIASQMLHAAALLSLLTAVRCCADSVVLRYDPDAVLDAIERHRGTAMLGPPAMYWALVRVQQRCPRDVRSGRSFVVCGDLAPSVLHDEFRSVFGRPLLPHYGMTEVFPITYSTDADGAGGRIGRPIPGVDVRIVNAQGEDVAAGSVGEIVVRSPTSMMCYWKDPDATAAVQRNGWIMTGDLGSLDVDGSVCFAARRKDIIVRAGSNISPAEVEQVLLSHPAVCEAAVLGVPDAVLGETVAACVVLQDGAHLESADLLEFVAARLSPYKVPEQVRFVTELPKTSTDKVRRHELKRLFVPLDTLCDGTVPKRPHPYPATV